MWHFKANISVCFYQAGDNTVKRCNFDRFVGVLDWMRQQKFHSKLHSIHDLAGIFHTEWVFSYWSLWRALKILWIRFLPSKNPPALYCLHAVRFMQVPTIGSFVFPTLSVLDYLAHNKKSFQCNPLAILFTHFRFWWIVYTMSSNKLSSPLRSTP